MTSRIYSFLVLLTIGATAAIAHTGVKDPQVMARMHLMKLVSEDMKVLGGIAKGQTAFDVQPVSQRSNNLAKHARDIEKLFEAPASDPKSEAKDTVWSDWNGFLTKATDMELAAQALADIKTKEDFAPAFQALGKTCSACHEGYRINTN